MLVKYIQKQILLLAHPIGSIYTSVDETSPAELFGGEWEQIADGRVLMGTSDSSKLNTTVEAGLPNITGGAVTAHDSGYCYHNVTGSSGAFYSGNQVTNLGRSAIASTYTGDNMLFIDASRSSAIYGKSTTVQPPALLVYIWKRTA